MPAVLTRLLRFLPQVGRASSSSSLESALMSQTRKRATADLPAPVAGHALATGVLDCESEVSLCTASSRTSFDLCLKPSASGIIRSALSAMWSSGHQLSLSLLRRAPQVHTRLDQATSYRPHSGSTSHISSPQRKAAQCQRPPNAPPLPALPVTVSSRAAGTCRLFTLAPRPGAHPLHRALGIQYLRTQLRLPPSHLPRMLKRLERRCSSRRR